MRALQAAPMVALWSYAACVLVEGAGLAKLPRGSRTAVPLAMDTKRLGWVRRSCCTVWLIMSSICGLIWRNVCMSAQLSEYNTAVFVIEYAERDRLCMSPGDSCMSTASSPK